MDEILSDIKSRVVKYLEISGIPREEFYRVTGIAASNFKGERCKSKLGGKKICDDAGYVRLVSHNPHHAPKDIPLTSIRALASVRYNTMG